jgi:hypothetical protein
MFFQEILRLQYVANALTNPETATLWQTDEVKERIITINLFGAKISKPLLLICYERLSPEDYTRLLDAVLIILFRNYIANPNYGSAIILTWDNIALAIYEKNIRDIKQIIELIKPIYIEDVPFKIRFSMLSLDTNSPQQKKILRYILTQLESSTTPIFDSKFKFDDVSIEHILPQNSYALYPDFNKKNHAQFVFRLGNLALLEIAKNTEEACAKNIVDKIAVFQTSQYHTTNNIQNITIWNEQAIVERQIEMAKTACVIWAL